MLSASVVIGALRVNSKEYIGGGAILFLLELTPIEKGGQNKNGRVNSLERDVPICLKMGSMQSQKRDIDGDTEKRNCTKQHLKHVCLHTSRSEVVGYFVIFPQQSIFHFCFDTPKIIIFYGGLIKFPSGLPCCMLA